MQSNSIVSRGRGNVVQSGKFLIDGRNKHVFNGGKAIPFHQKMTGEHIIQAGDHLIVDGYKLVDDAWVSIHKKDKGLVKKLINWIKGADENE